LFTRVTVIGIYSAVAMGYLFMHWGFEQRRSLTMGLEKDFM